MTLSLELYFKYKSLPLFQVFPLWFSGFSPGWAGLGSLQENHALTSVMLPWVPETFLARFPVSVKKQRNPSSIYSSPAGYLLSFGSMSCPG